jgi:uncharacterized membrane protein
VRVRRGFVSDRPIWLKATLVLAILVLAYGLAYMPLAAQEDGQQQQQYPYVYSSYNLDIQVEADASLHVQERVVYSFNGFGEWVGIYIPFEYGEIYKPRVLNEYGRPLPDELQKMEWSDEGVTLWYNGEGSRGNSTVIYDYYLYGALDRKGDLIGLDWSATPEIHSVPILASSVNLHLPGYVSSSNLELQVRAFNYEGAVTADQPDGNTVYCRSQDIPPDAYYRFNCFWPSSIMDNTYIAVTPDTSLGGKHWDFARFDTDIQVNPDASLTIRETQVANFYGSYHFLNRDLVTTKAAGVGGKTCGRVRFSDIQVYDLEGNPYDKNLWSVEKTSDGKRVHIEFEAQDQQMGWIIEYRMAGAIIYYDDYDRIYFNSVSYDREVPIATSTTTVQLPEGTDTQNVSTDMYIDSYNKPDSSDRGVDGDTLWWKVRNVKPYTTYTIDVSFPKGVVTAPLQFRDSFLLAMLALSALIILASLGYMLWLWRRKGRDVGGNDTEMVRYDPPPGLNPAIIGMLIKEKPLLKDISATIVDLARRGYLTIFESGTGSLFSHKTYGFTKKNNVQEGLLGYEKEIMDGLFESGDQVTEADLKNEFYVHITTIQEGVTSEVMRKKLFFAEPAKVKKRFSRIGSSIFLASLAFFLVMRVWWDLGWIWLLLPALLLSGLIVMIVGRAMPRRTPEGSQAYEHAKGFKDYLVTAEKQELASMTADNFQETLPFAMVLGVADIWAAKFTDIFTTPPEWFNGVGTFSTVYLASSLNGMYNDLGGTLTSAPGSSGGGGGGFSGGFGGGFSGGGFGGGGSSAG